MHLLVTSKIKTRNSEKREQENYKRKEKNKRKQKLHKGYRKNVQHVYMKKKAIKAVRHSTYSALVTAI